MSLHYQNFVPCTYEKVAVDKTTKRYQQNMRYITKEDRTVAALTILSGMALMGVVMLSGAVVDDADSRGQAIYDIPRR